VPALAVAAATGFGLKRDMAVAMVLLAASPFAPVVPVFARMVRADLALAAGLTAAFPLVSVLLTPLAARAAMQVLAQTDSLRFNMLTSLATLAATIPCRWRPGCWSGIAPRTWDGGCCVRSR